MFSKEVIKIKKILVCSAWPYGYSIPHLGNLMSSMLSGDVFARFYRMRGHDTLYVSGTDMHGSKAEFEAMKRKTTPEKITNGVHEKIKELLKEFGIEFDNYTSTESPVHKEFVNEVYQQMDEHGYIFSKDEKRAFCTNCKIFLSDAFIEGTCPKCKAKNAKGNQCDACSSLLEPEELIEPVCVVCSKNKIEFRTTTNWFLDLAKLEPLITKYVDGHPEWKGNVKHFTANLLKGGLKPRAITRDLKWGIPAPFDGAEDKVIYVWAEAALGYVSATKEHTKDWTKFWFGDNVKQIYTMAKDNIPFHTILFPGQLIASGEKYHLPDQIAATEYLNWEGGKKFSKSRNVGIYIDEALKLLPAEYWRFYLLYDRPEGKDANFSWSELDKAVNQVLIADFGNFVNRTITLLHKFYEGKVPEAELDEEDYNVWDNVSKTEEHVITQLEDGNLREALNEIIKLCKVGNGFLQKREPWKNEEHRATTLYVCTQLMKSIAVMFYPFIPTVSEKVWHLLNINEKIVWNEIGEKLEAGHAIQKPELIIQKIDITEVKKAYEKMKNDKL